MAEPSNNGSQESILEKMQGLQTTSLTDLHASPSTSSNITVKERPTTLGPMRLRILSSDDRSLMNRFISSVEKTEGRKRERDDDEDDREGKFRRLIVPADLQALYKRGRNALAKQAKFYVANLYYKYEYEYDVSLTTSKPQSGHHQSQ